MSFVKGIGFIAGVYVAAFVIGVAAIYGVEILFAPVWNLWHTLAIAAPLLIAAQIVVSRFQYRFWIWHIHQDLVLQSPESIPAGLLFERDTISGYPNGQIWWRGFPRLRFVHTRDVFMDRFVGILFQNNHRKLARVSVGFGWQICIYYGRSNEL